MPKYVKPLDKDEESKGNAKYRLPFALCKQRGIQLPDWATPRDAWNALKDKLGVEPEEVYKELNEENKVVDAQVEVNKDTIIKSKAFNTLPKGPKEKIEKALDKLSSEQLGIVSKYIGRLYEFTDGSGQYGTGGGYIRYEQNSNGKGLAKELGYDFDACTFYHEYGHFVDNMIGKDTTGYNMKYDSVTVSVHEDALSCFNELVKIGGGTELKDLSRIKREQYQAFYKGMAKVTGKDQLWLHKNKTDFGYIREPYKPTYTPERAKELFGDYAYDNAVKLWEKYNQDYGAWQKAEADGTNLRAEEKQKQYLKEMEEHNAPIHNNLERCSILSDFFGLYTNNKINLHKDGYWGHGGSYNKFHAVQTETWAEYFSFKMTNDTKGLDIMKKYLPKTYQAFEDKYNKLKEN